MKIPIAITSLLLCINAYSQGNIVSAEYFIDNDPGFGNGNSIDITSGMSINAEDLMIAAEGDEGLHFLYCRVLDENGQWSIPVHKPYFLHESNVAEIDAAEYFIDDDPGHGMATAMPISVGLNVDEQIQASTEGLEEGWHWFYARIRDSNGNWSLALKRPFVVTDTQEENVVAAEYFVDEDPGLGNATPLSISPAPIVNDNFSFEVTDDLEPGDHFLYLRVQNESGEWSLDRIDVFEVLLVSVDENALSKLNIYPNPTKEAFRVDSGDLNIQKIRILDDRGRCVMEKSNSNAIWDVSNRDSGLYLVQIWTENNVISKKLIIE